MFTKVPVRTQNSKNVDDFFFIISVPQIPVSREINNLDYFCLLSKTLKSTNGGCQGFDMLIWVRKLNKLYIFLDNLLFFVKNLSAAKYVFWQGRRGGGDLISYLYFCCWKVILFTLIYAWYYLFLTIPVRNVIYDFIIIKILLFGKFKIRMLK